MKYRDRVLFATATALALGSGYVVAQDEMASEGSAEREGLRKLAAQTIAQLEASDEVVVDIDSAEAYAVFDTTKAGLLVTGTGGTGIAIDNDSGKETFMHIGGAGVGLGAGVASYQLVVVFHADSDFQQFVDGQWSGGVSAQAVAGDEGGSEEIQSLEGVHLYRVSDEGLIAQADLTGVRFWPDDDLNPS
jgi:lipid-binding SYLF domain-containing protein